ncbi:MAG: hypothetical protein DMF27_02900 [Verrucomicrobia bacterium]|nr:MAG: hypothetical protein DMF27_02900 [Verrucomicrobiota bacterium]
MDLNREKGSFAGDAQVQRSPRRVFHRTNIVKSSKADGSRKVRFGETPKPAREVRAGLALLKRSAIAEATA